MINRIHNSAESDLELYPCSYELRNSKPSGIWYALNQEWVEFCKDSQGFLFPHNYTIEVQGDRLCVINNFFQLSEFMEAYGSWGKDFGFTIKYSPDWTEVSKYFAGFEMHNFRQIKQDYERYQYVNRNQKLPSWTWFYSLDASSGVIWDISAIKSMNRIPMPEKK